MNEVKTRAASATAVVPKNSMSRKTRLTPHGQNETLLAVNPRMPTFDTIGQRPVEQRAPDAAANLRRPASDPLLRQKYHELTLKHSKALGSVFAEFTGLRFHVAWTPSHTVALDSQRQWKHDLILCPFAGKKRYSANGCGQCVPKHLTRALKSGGKGHWFACDQGYLNYWLPICIRGAAVGIAHLQALDGEKATRPARSRLGRSAPKKPHHLKFHRACRLLKLMVAYIETVDLAELQKADLTNARRMVIALKCQQTRLRKRLSRVLPAAAGMFKDDGPRTGTHAERVLHCLLDCVHRNYMQSMTLQECAARLGINAAYLSALFSRYVGIPFKTYLTELRLHKAREMLCDSSRNISEVAYAVGYASENRFRIAFKKAVGLSPRQWRDG